MYIVAGKNSKKIATVNYISQPGQDAICIRMLLRSDLTLINGSEAFPIYLKTLV
jgi:hypothetical protein